MDRGYKLLQVYLLAVRQYCAIIYSIVITQAEADSWRVNKEILVAKLSKRLSDYKDECESHGGSWQGSLLPTLHVQVLVTCAALRKVKLSGIYI